MKVVIVGGVAGGATAAARLRRLDETAEIVVFERSHYISYANCGLPYYIGGVIEDANELTLQTPERFDARFNVKMKVRHEVLAIHPDTKTVEVKNLETNEVFSESYDHLILASGAKPLLPPFEGLDLEEIFTLRTVEDTLKIKDYINHHDIRSVVIAGGGFIGIELAENLKELGLSVTVVQALNQVMTPFDPDMAAFIQSEMRLHGVQLKLGAAVEGFKKTEQGIDVLLKDLPAVHADLAVVAIGVMPDTKLAQDAGLKLGIKNSIVVDDQMRTSIPNIYAVGDAVQIQNYITKQDTLISLAGPANKQGRIVADVICGKESHYKGGIGSSVIKVFDLTAAATGLNVASAKQMGLDVDYVVLSPMSHAGYYPGGKTMVVKVVFEKQTDRLLGAQIIGYEGVDKRIDVLATAIYNQMHASELKDLDLAYAPPYSSAKDPVNLAGFMIENIHDGQLKQWYLDDVDRVVHDETIMRLDVRTPEEYAQGHVNGFTNIPVDELRNHLDKLDPAKPVYLMCHSGLRSYIASCILKGRGFDAYNFTGGYSFYRAVMQETKLMECTSACGMEQTK